MLVASLWMNPAETPRQFLSACLDESWMAHLLRRHGLFGGRITVVTLLLFD